MSAPCVVCGAPATRSHLCRTCDDAWNESSECERMSLAMGSGAGSVDAPFLDYVRRRWVERLNSRPTLNPEDMDTGGDAAPNQWKTVEK